MINAWRMGWQEGRWKASWNFFVYWSSFTVRFNILLSCIVLCTKAALKISVLPILCRTFRQIRKVNSAAEEKHLNSYSNSPFLKEFGLNKNTIFVCVSWKMTIVLGHFFLKEGKRGGKKFVKILPLFGLFCSISAKVLLPNCMAVPFFIRPFWLMRPNNRPVCNTGKHYFLSISQGGCVE